MAAATDTTEEEMTYYDLFGLKLDATADEIKKVYRKLALELHPDKLVGSNLNEEELAHATARFLKVQEAYDCLGDTEKRLQYDLKLTGVQYDQIPTDDTSKENRYMRSRYGTSISFNLFMKSKRFKMHFTASFQKPKVPDIVVNLDIDLQYVLRGLNKVHKFYKRVICDVCGGNGGLDGVCTTCPLCQGTGIAKHLYFHPHTYAHSHDPEHGPTATVHHLHACAQGRKGYADTEDCDVSFGSVSETTCAACNGKGCHPTHKCPSCSGTGMKMKEATVTIALSPGFKNKYEVSIPGIGHQDFDGRKGDLLVHLNYKIPPNWLYDEATGRLTYLKIEPIDTFLPFLALPENATASKSYKSWMSSMFFGTNADKDQETEKETDKGAENGVEKKNANLNSNSNATDTTTTSMSSANTTTTAVESGGPPVVLVTLGTIEMSTTGGSNHTDDTNTNNHTMDDSDIDRDIDSNNNNANSTTTNNSKTGFVIKVPTIPPPSPSVEEEDEIKINIFKTSSSSSSSSSSASSHRPHQFTSEILSPTGETVPLVLDHFTLHMQHLLSGINVTVPHYGLLLEQGSSERGPLTVIYSIDWSTVTPEIFQRLLLADGGQDADEDRQGGLGSINPLFLRIADLFNMTTSTLRSPALASSSSTTASDQEDTNLDEDIDSDNDDINVDETSDDDDQSERQKTKKTTGKRSGFGSLPRQGKGKGPKKGKKKSVSSPIFHGKYSIDTNDITVVKKNMFREGKVHFYTASLPGFI